MKAHLPPSMALSAASEVLLLTAKGLLDNYVSVSTPWGLVRTHKALKAFLAIQSCKNLQRLQASSEAQHAKIDRFKN